MLNIFRKKNNPNITRQVFADPFYDESKLSFHQRALRSTRYGIGDIIRAEVEDGKVKFRLLPTGEIFDDALGAFNAASPLNVTTYSRLTGDMLTSSYNTRGLTGLEERLLSMQEGLKTGEGLRLAQELGIEDPSKLYFGVGTYKTGLGAKGTMKDILSKLGEGLYVSDKDEFNLLQVFYGEAGKGKAFGLQDISRLFAATSGDIGGLFSKEGIMKALQNEDLGTLFSKAGKRFRGAIGLRDVSLSGQILEEVLSEAGIAGKILNTQNIKIFNVAGDLTQVAERFLETGTFQRAFDMFDEEGKAFYEGGHTQDLVLETLKTAGVIDENGNIVGTLDGGAKKIFEGGIESAYDGTALLNAKVARAMEKRFNEELTQLKTMTRTPQIDARIMELTSQLDNIRSGNLQALTTRTFFKDAESNPVMMKAVFDARKLKGPLDKYFAVTTDVALKKETALMGETSAMNLVLQGETTGRVYYDPLAPAFHYNIFSGEDYVKAQQVRRTRVLNSLKEVYETGQVGPSLRGTISKMAEAEDFDGLPSAVRSARYRNREFARSLKNAVESGTDLRTMPELMNFLHKNAMADLYRVKDGEYQIAMEGVFRVALDTEASFYSGTTNATQAFLGSGLEQIEMLGMPTPLKALQFQVQGHKMLFGGNAAQIFKHSLGGFDLDDKGIVVPKLFYDASGNERLATFIFRQPTGPAEFIFGMPKFGSSDTIKTFFEASDGLSQALEIVRQRADNEVYKNIAESLTATGRAKNALDRQLLLNADNNLYEQGIINIMRTAEEEGLYKIQRFSSADPVMKMMADASVSTGEAVASPIQLTQSRIKELLELYRNAPTPEEAKRVLSEQFLVNQYNYGNLERVFKESAKLELKPIEEELKAVTGLTGDITQQNLHSFLQANPHMYQRVAPILEGLYGMKSQEALMRVTNIGSYINPMTVISSGLDLETDAIEALKQKGVAENTIKSLLEETKIGIISPSDVVDLVNTMSGEQYLADETQVYDSLASLLEREDVGNVGKIKALERIFNVSPEQKLENIVAQTAESAISARFERIGRLRALGIEHGLEQELMAGIDPAILRRRLNNNKLSEVAIGALEKGFVGQLGSSYMDKINANEQMKNYYEQIKKARNIEEGQNLVDNVIGLAGIDKASKYAHASTNLQLGLEAKESGDALKSMFTARRTVENMREINISEEATRLAGNILDEFKRMSGDSAELIQALQNEGVQSSEYFKYLGKAKVQEIGESIKDMIFSAASRSEGTTVQDILDNMERLSYTSQHRRGAHYRAFLTAGDDPNELVSLAQAAQYQRRVKFLERQEGIKDLTDQYQAFMTSHRAASETEKTYNIKMARSLLEDFKANRQANITSDDARIAAAFLIEAKEEGVANLLNEQDLLAARRIQQLSTSKRYLQELEFQGENNLGEILTFGGRSSASNFAPPPVDLNPEVEERLFGSIDDGVEVAKPLYKRFMKGAEDLKINQAFKNPVVKGSAFALAGLIAGSFLYSKAKDRGEQEIAGPPLLPGGSSYENLPQRQPQIPNASMFSGYNQGIGYTVNIERIKRSSRIF